MNRFRRNLVKITNIFALLHRPHLHFTQVLNSCSCILPAAGRRPPGGSGELRSPAAVLPHRRACGRPPAPCTTRRRATIPTPFLPPHLPCRCPLPPRRNRRRSRAPLQGRTPRGEAAGAGLRPAAAPPPPPITSSKSTARRRSHRSAPGVPFRAVVTAAAPPSYLPWGGP